MLSRSPLGDLVRAGKRSLRRLWPLLAPGPAILMYHRIADESFDPWGLAVSPENFADQIDWLKQNRTILSLPEFVELHRQGRLPRNATALTFDDGYACSANVAVPLLEKVGIPSMIFLPADLIERGCEFWWDELERIVLDSKSAVLTLGGHEVALGKPDPEDKNWPPAAEPRTARQRAYHQFWSLLYAMAPDELETGMKQLREQAKLTEKPRDSHRPMTPAEVRRSKSALVKFGSHALSHASLPLLAPDEKAREIAGSIDRCTELTGARPHSFAYPYGNFDAELRPIGGGGRLFLRGEGRRPLRRPKEQSLRPAAAVRGKLEPH